MINLIVTNYLQSFLVLKRMAITLDKVIRAINARAVPNMIPWSELEMAMFHWSAIAAICLVNSPVMSKEIDVTAIIRISRRKIYGRLISL